jgi:hypothetical protein
VYSERGLKVALSALAHRPTASLLQVAGELFVERVEIFCEAVVQTGDFRAACKSSGLNERQGRRILTDRALYWALWSVNSENFLSASNQSIKE